MGGAQVLKTSQNKSNPWAKNQERPHPNTSHEFP